ncbi:MAG: ABC transporter ATP-binding protein [Calditrichaceae bacterium]
MIRIENVSKIYQKNGSAEVHALQDVSLEIQKGEFVAIIGPSGSGKSTLMNILGMLDRPTRGSYYLKDRKVSDLTIDELAKIRNREIGFVFQQFHLLARTSALENVELPLLYSDRPDMGKLAQKSLEAVGLGSRIHHIPSELSGGQQQRVVIARALVNDPEIIFADEPTGNLDSRSGIEIMSIFQELNKKGRTVIVITHDQNIAEHSRRVIRIADGRITDDYINEHPRQAEVVQTDSGEEAAHENK